MILPNWYWIVASVWLSLLFAARHRVHGKTSQFQTLCGHFTCILLAVVWPASMLCACWLTSQDKKKQ